MLWVWSTKAESYGVSVNAQVARALYVAKPSFTICPVAHGTTCKLGNLPTGQTDELEAAVKVGSKAAIGEQVQISAKATASRGLSYTGSATDIVAVNPLTVDPTITLPPASLPAIPGTAVSATNPSDLFPTVQASLSPTPTSLGLPKVKSRPQLRAADAASTVPLDDELIGGQLAGLAVLAGAVMIAITRLSLRRAKPHDESGNRPQD